MLSKLLSLKKADLKAKIQSIDASGVKDRGLRRRFQRIRNKQGGFTLLELLVVVAILAAIAGTASLMLQDTDRKQAAGAHVTMMAELSNAIQTYRVLNNAYPDVWDSLFANAAGDLDGAQPLAILSEDLFDPTLGATPGGGSNLELSTLSADDVAALDAVGIRRVRVVDTDATNADWPASVSCDNTRADAGIGGLIRNKGNDVTAQNIYRTPEANGCGAAGHHALAASNPVMVWGGDPQRVGVPIGATTDAEHNKLVAFGIGPDSTLFSPSQLGAMTNVPVYRHVAADEYNRFIVLFNLNPSKMVWDAATSAETEQAAGGQAIFQAIIDGAGDTKDEELGELDGMRPT
jgi:prepilin-type N-terminal cleavage/methylation domain-containing protein